MALGKYFPLGWAGRQFIAVTSRITPKLSPFCSSGDLLSLQPSSILTSLVFFLTLPESILICISPRPTKSTFPCRFTIINCTLFECFTSNANNVQHILNNNMRPSRVTSGARTRFYATLHTKPFVNLLAMSSFFLL